MDSELQAYLWGILELDWDGKATLNMSNVIPWTGVLAEDKRESELSTNMYLSPFLAADAMLPTGLNSCSQNFPAMTDCTLKFETSYPLLAYAAFVRCFVSMIKVTDLWALKAILCMVLQTQSLHSNSLAGKLNVLVAILWQTLWGSALQRYWGQPNTSIVNLAPHSCTS